MAYPWAEMAFCCHCGKPAEGGLFCAACGKPIPPDAVEAMTAEFHRYHKEMRLTVVALGLVIVVTAGLIVNGVMHEKRAAGRSLFGGEASSPTLRQQQPAPTQPTTTQTPPGQAVTPGPFTSQPQQPVPEVIAPGKSNPASRPPTGGIDPQAVQNALTTLVEHGKPRDPSLQQRPALSVNPIGSDRYPGSQPVEVKDADLPDIGIPVASQVYTTSDSSSTVISYYRQRYPNAEVTEISGQKVIAVTDPGATKVIAVGTTGSETRIAIVQPAN
jgi:predicted nucleic acid-binding Zn ribbon protein